MSIPIFYSGQLAEFDFGPGHPFTGERYESFITLLEGAGILDSCELMEPRPASDEDLMLAHSPEYLKYVTFLQNTGGYLSMDTPATPSVVRIQRLVAGSGLQAAELLVKSNIKTAHTFGGFHHAGRDYGEGFCVYNDVAIVAEALLKRHDVKRVLILDTDAHQGNGTMDLFYSHPKVLFISVHQDPRTLYPGKGFVWETGSNEGKGYTVNLPMPPHSGVEQYEHVFDEVVCPISREFAPDVMIRNGGSDPYYADELTFLGLDLGGLNTMGRRVRGIVKDTGSKLVDMMVSGYGKHVIYGWLALFCGVEGLDADYKAASPEEPTVTPYPDEDKLNAHTEAMVKELRQNLKDYWACL